MISLHLERYDLVWNFLVALIYSSTESLPALLLPALNFVMLVQVIGELVWPQKFYARFQVRKKFFFEIILEGAGRKLSVCTSNICFSWSSSDAVHSSMRAQTEGESRNKHFLLSWNQTST